MQIAKQELRGLGTELIPIAVPRGGDAVGALGQHRERADVLWMANDPVLKKFEAVKEACTACRLPLITSFSDSFARSGALMSVSVKLHAVGAQAAAMARLVLEHGAKPHDLGVQHPNGARLVLNAATADALGVDIPPDMLSYIDEIIDTDAGVQNP